MGFLLRVVVNAAAIYLAATIVPGIEVTNALVALGAGLVLGLVNAVVRPVLLVLTLPFTIVTLGLFLFVLNGFGLWLTSALVKGFEVHGFWPAVLAALIVSVVSWVVGRRPAVREGEGHANTSPAGVLVLAMPKFAPGQPGVAAEIKLAAIEATRGERAGHVSRTLRPTTTEEHLRPHRRRAID